MDPRKLELSQRSRPLLVALCLTLLTGVLVASCASVVETEAPAIPQTTITVTPLIDTIPTLGLPDGPPPSPTPALVVSATPGSSATPLHVSPTPSPVVQLLPTPPDTGRLVCEDSPLSYLRVGDFAFVSYDPYLPSRVRTRPDVSSRTVLDLINPGEVVQIVDGPACFNQAVWWKVTSQRRVLTGWAQEGDQTNYWLIRTEKAAGGRVPPSAQQSTCLVEDEAFCTFTNDLEGLIVRGDIDAVLERTQVSGCGLNQDVAGEASENRCALWGVFGSEGSGLAQTPVAFIRSSWSTFAASNRRLVSLLLPPFEGLPPDQMAVLQAPALFIDTGDPQWDWLLFLEKPGGEWRLFALVMISRETDVYRSLLMNAIPWP